LKSYSQPTLESRYQIYSFKAAGYSQVEIAGELGVHPSTISRELKRNTGNRRYRPKQAQSLADSRSFGNTNATKFQESIGNSLVNY
jgi:IS30 family transposase